MTDHDLKVGVIVDLDIGRCGCARGLESNTCDDVVKEVIPVPRCLPLGPHFESGKRKREAGGTTYNIKDSLWSHRQNEGKQSASDKGVSHCER